MKRPLFWKLLVCVFTLCALAAINLWGLYPAQQTLVDNTENDGIQLTPKENVPLYAAIPTQSFSRSTFGGIPYRVGRIITPTTTLPEAETNISSNPANPATLVAVIIDYSLRPGNVDTNGVTKFAVSNDSGRTWTESFVPLASNVYGSTSDGFSWLVDRDPGIAVDLSGNVFISGLYLKFPGSQTNSLFHAVVPGGMYVCVGTLPSVSLT